MSKPLDLREILSKSDEMKFDNRLLEKKVEHGFLKPQERDAFLKGLSEESEYEFTSMEEVEKPEEPTA